MTSGSGSRMFFQTLNKLSECEECGREAELTHLEGVGYVCSECESEFSQCDDCHLYADRDGMTILANGERICHSCIDLGGYGRCDNCGEYAAEDDMTILANGQQVCESCINSDDYYECRECGEIHHYSDMSTDDICDACWEEMRHRIRDHHEGPDPNPLDDGEPLIGVELEIDGGERADVVDQLMDLSDSEALFWMEEDGSLSDEGIEIISHPASAHYHTHKYPWADICHIVSKAGYYSHNTSDCGLHIHLERRRLSIRQQLAIGVHIYNHLQQWQQFCRRKVNGYCKSKPPEKHLEELRACPSYPPIQDDRYEVLNYQNADTIEFRLPRGTLKPETIKATIQAIDALWHYVRRPETSLDDIAQPQAWDDFIQYATADRRAELRQYLVGRALMRKEKD